MTHTTPPNLRGQSRGAISIRATAGSSSRQQPCVKTRPGIPHRIAYRARRRAVRAWRTNHRKQLPGAKRQREASPGIRPPDRARTYTNDASRVRHVGSCVRTDTLVCSPRVRLTVRPSVLSSSRLVSSRSISLFFVVRATTRKQKRKPIRALLLSPSPPARA